MKPRLVQRVEWRVVDTTTKATSAHRSRRIARAVARNVNAINPDHHLRAFHVLVTEVWTEA
jgi:hypothetical protein